MAFHEPEYEKHVTFFYVCVKEIEMYSTAGSAALSLDFLCLKALTFVCFLNICMCEKRLSEHMKWKAAGSVFPIQIPNNLVLLPIFPPVQLQMGVPLLQVYFIAQKSLCLHVCNNEMWTFFISLCCSVILKCVCMMLQCMYRHYALYLLEVPSVCICCQQSI